MEEKTEWFTEIVLYNRDIAILSQDYKKIRSLIKELERWIKNREKKDLEVMTLEVAKSMLQNYESMLRYLFVTSHLDKRERKEVAP